MAAVGVMGVMGSGPRVGGEGDGAGKGGVGGGEGGPIKRVHVR